MLASTGIILLFSTIIEQNFYKREYFGVFKEINKAVIDLQKKYGTENVTTTLNTSDIDIMNFYFERWNSTIDYDFYTGDSPDFTEKMLHKIDSCTTPYFIYGWSNFRSPYEIPELIKRKFPCVIYDEKHFNSQVTLFGKNDSCKRDTIFYSQIGFENHIPDFSYDSAKTDTSHFHLGKHSLNIESKNEFCITLKTSVKKLFTDNSECVNVSAWIHPNEMFNAQFVMEVGDSQGKIEWQAKLLSQFAKNVGQWQEVFATFELPSSTYPDDEVKI